MPLLLEDLADETSANNRRVADRLDVEARDLHRREQEVEEPGKQELRERAVLSARQGTDHALAQVPVAEGAWRSALAWLRRSPTGADAESLLRRLLNLFESCLQLVRQARALWAIPERLHAGAERLAELDRAQQRFEELGAEVTAALEHRAGGWQPADLDRLARGLQLAREGKTVKSDEARTWFRRT